MSKGEKKKALQWKPMEVPPVFRDEIPPYTYIPYWDDDSASSVSKPFSPTTSTNNTNMYPLNFPIGTEVIAVKPCDGVTGYVGLKGIIVKTETPSDKPYLVTKPYLVKFYHDPVVQLPVPSLTWWCEEESLQLYSHGGQGLVLISNTADITLKNKKPKAKKKVHKLNVDALNDLIIQEHAKKEIISLLEQRRYSETLFERWGLGKMMKYGKGMTFLFWGPPGTGKTWGASKIADALGKELLVLSAADVQTSEPGGANRAIKEAFASAKSNKKVLFIDECDSLISSRNHLGMILASEVNTLLTEIEQSEEVIILATNRISNMDEALERRIALIVEFPRPDFDLRVRIWKKMMPKKFPLDTDVSIDDLAKEDLSGGEIKNVLLHAARLAVTEKKKKVSMKHFTSALNHAKSTKGKMGKDTWDQREDMVPATRAQSELEKVKHFLKHHEDIIGHNH